MFTSEIDKCCLYVSDFHLEMILLPYIKEKMKRNDVIILTERNLEETVKILIERLNLKKEIKQKIYNINWTNDENNFDKITRNTNVEKTIIINGENEYFEKCINIINQCNVQNYEVIRCFDINKYRKIDVNNYTVLNTARVTM